MSAITEAGAVVAAGAVIGGYCYSTPVYLWWARLRERWSTSKTIVEHAARPDHALCEGDCGQVICRCAGATADSVCVGTVEQACTHHTPLCGDCRLAECPDCRLDYLHDSEVL